MELISMNNLHVVNSVSNHSKDTEENYKQKFLIIGIKSVITIRRICNETVFKIYKEKY